MRKVCVYCVLALVLSSCTSTKDNIFGESASQIQKRNYQSRRFDTNDKVMVMKAILATMQDLGFVVERANEALGTISGTDFVHSSKLTVSVQLVGQQIRVRANASVDKNEIDSPSAYQNFFNALGKSLFLEARVDS